MRILVIYPYIPFPVDRGAYQRTYHLLRALAAENEVDLIALSEGGERLDQQAHFESFCNQVTLVPFTHPDWHSLANRLMHALPTTIRHWTLPHLGQVIDQALEATHYDLVHVCDIVMAQYFMVKHRDMPLSIDRSRVDLQFQLAKRETMGRGGLKQRVLDSENLFKLRRFERAVARRAQMHVVCGPDDETFTRAEISKTVPVTVVANGVDLDYFAPVPDSPRAEAPTVLFCGAMDYVPNVDALRWFFGGMHQALLAAMPDLQVLIVGKSPVAEVEAYASRQGVTVTGSVPDVRPYYRQSWLQIVPLRIGGGTRLKIVESMAIGTPVVSTTIGAQGLDLVHGKDILLADTAEDFVEQTLRGLRDVALRDALRVEGMAVVNQRLSWPMLGRQLCEVYNQHFGPGRPLRRELLGIPLDHVTSNQTIECISKLIKTGQPHYVATANVDFAVQARTDGALRSALHFASLVVADGLPLVWASKWFGQPLPERVAGSDITPDLLARAEKEGWRVYFLGGRPEVTSRAVTEVSKRHPGIQIAGWLSPKFAPLDKMDHEGICREIREADTDLLLVSFGCPKQEKWLAMNRHQLGKGVGIGVGATVDFLAGEMKRAPVWMRENGLEWVFRLAQEPRRLFRRYAKDLFTFSWMVPREFLRRLVTSWQAQPIKTVPFRPVAPIAHFAPLHAMPIKTAHSS